MPAHASIVPQYEPLGSQVLWLDAADSDAKASRLSKQPPHSCRQVHRRAGAALPQRDLFLDALYEVILLTIVDDEQVARDEVAELPVRNRYVTARGGNQRQWVAAAGLSDLLPRFLVRGGRNRARVDDVHVRLIGKRHDS